MHACKETQECRIGARLSSASSDPTVHLALPFGFLPVCLPQRMLPRALNRRERGGQHSPVGGHTPRSGEAQQGWNSSDGWTAALPASPHSPSTADTSGTAGLAVQLPPRTQPLPRSHSPHHLAAHSASAMAPSPLPPFSPVVFSPSPRLSELAEQQQQQHSPARHDGDAQQQRQRLDSWRTEESSLAAAGSGMRLREGMSPARRVLPAASGTRDGSGIQAPPDSTTGIPVSQQLRQWLRCCGCRALYNSSKKMDDDDVVEDELDFLSSGSDASPARGAKRSPSRHGSQQRPKRAQLPSRLIAASLLLIFVVFYCLSVAWTCSPLGGGVCRYDFYLSEPATAENDDTLLLRPRQKAKLPQSAASSALSFLSRVGSHVGMGGGDGDELPAAPFTIMSLLRDMSDESFVENRSQYVIQWNALHSWLELVPAAHIIVFMDTQTSCDRLVRSSPNGALRDIQCIPVPCWSDEHHRPLLDCLFNTASARSRTELLAYVNGDILLHSDVASVVRQVSAWFPQQFMLVSRRTDTLVPRAVLDEFGSLENPQHQVPQLLRRALTHGQLHSEFGIDLFVFPRALFATLNFPAFLAGVYRWDNWLLSEMILREHVAVVDATRLGLVVHQEMRKVSHQGRTGAGYNDRLAKGRSGLHYKLGNIRNADYVVAWEDDEIVAARRHVPLRREEEEARYPGERDSLAPLIFALPVVPPSRPDAPELVSSAPALLSSLSLSSTPSTPQFRLRANDAAAIEVLIAQRADPRTQWLMVVSVSSWDVESGAADSFLCWAQRQEFRHFVFIAEDQASARIMRIRGAPVLVHDQAPERAALDRSVRVIGGLADDLFERSPPEVALGEVGALTSGLPTVDCFDTLMFRAEFFSLVLRAGVSFVAARATTLLTGDVLGFFHQAVASGGQLPSPFGFHDFEEARAAQQPPDLTPEQAADPEYVPPPIFDVAGIPRNQNELTNGGGGSGASKATDKEAIDDRFFAVRASVTGKWFWSQVSLCEEENGQKLYAQVLATAELTRRFADNATLPDDPDPSLASRAHMPATGIIPGSKRTSLRPEERVQDCLARVMHKHAKKLTTLLLPSLSFPRFEDYFLRQATQLNGVLPLAIIDDEPLSLHNSRRPLEPITEENMDRITMAPTTTTTKKKPKDTGTTMPFVHAPGPGVHSIDAGSDGRASSVRRDTILVPSQLNEAAWVEEYSSRVREHRLAQMRRWEHWHLRSAGPEPTADGSPTCLPLLSDAAAEGSPPEAPVTVEAWDTFLEEHASWAAATPGAEPLVSLTGVLNAPIALSAVVGAPPLRGTASSASVAPDPRAAAASSSSSLPVSLSPLSFTFRIRVLTFDRPRSLARLLASLQEVDWEGDRVALEISVDAVPAATPTSEGDEERLHKQRLVHTVCDSFVWRHGQYSVVHQQQNIGLTGQWTWAWNAPDLARREVMLLLEDDTALVPSSWRWLKRAIQAYWLNPHNHDPRMFGLSLQSQHTVLGESTRFRYGTRDTHEMLDPRDLYYRYQLLGTWGTIFFPAHWNAFTQWLRSRAFVHTQGKSEMGFQPCVPALLSNFWWEGKPRGVWSQWFVRFAYEKGWYGLYTNFPSHASLVVNYREGGLNFKESRGPMNPAMETVLDQWLVFPPLNSLPLLDFHFRDFRSRPHLLSMVPLLSGASLPGSTDPDTGLTSMIPPPGPVFPRDDCFIIKQSKALAAERDQDVRAQESELKELEDARIEARNAARMLVAEQFEREKLEAAAAMAARLGPDPEAAREAAQALEADRLKRLRRLAPVPNDAAAAADDEEEEEEEEDVLGEGDEDEELEELQAAQSDAEAEAAAAAVAAAAPVPVPLSEENEENEEDEADEEQEPPSPPPPPSKKPKKAASTAAPAPASKPKKKKTVVIEE